MYDPVMGFFPLAGDFVSADFRNTEPGDGGPGKNRSPPVSGSENCGDELLAAGAALEKARAGAELRAILLRATTEFVWSLIKATT